MNRQSLIPFLCAAAVVMVAPAEVRAAEQPGAALIASEAEARGDFDTWLGELCADVARDPEDPSALLMLWRIRDLMGDATDPTVVERALEPLTVRGVSDGEVDELLRDVLSRRARMRGEFDAARAYNTERGYLRRFAVIGPFDSERDSLVWKAFPPETETIDFSAPMTGEAGKVRWLQASTEGESSWVSPYEQIRRGGSGVVYAVAHVRSATARTVALKLWCSDSFKVMVNGREAVTADRSRDRTPSVVWCTARLEPGWNRIMVKVIGNANFAVKVTDAATGRPLDDLTEGDPFETGIVDAMGAPAEPRSYRTPFERASAVAARREATTLDHAVAAGLASWENRDWEALEQWRLAAASVNDKSARSANVCAAYGRELAGFQPYPPVQRKLLAQQQFTLALGFDPEHNSAQLRMARYENEDDRPEKAVAALEKYLQSTPSSSAFMELARVTQARGWEKEALDAARAALALSPNLTDAMDFLDGYDRRYGNQEALLERAKTRLASDKSDTRASRRMIDALRARGADDEALAELHKLADRYPGSIGYRREIAEILRNLGRTDESLAAWSELEKRVPEEASYPSEIAEIEEVAGHKEKAVAAYRRSLALRPFQPTIWRALSRMEGTEFDFGAGWEPDVQELMAGLPSTEELKAKYPQAVAITVLDHSVERIAPDGSTVTYVNMLYKALDEKGVQKYSDVPNSGEVLEIAAYLPDGTKMLPTGLGGQNFNMEGLVPGSFIHHRSVWFGGPARDGTFDGSKFYFQDHELRGNPNPVLLSRWVVISPKDMKLDPVARKFPEGPKTEEFEGDVATIWEKRDMPRIEYEAHMPDVDEVVPTVDYGKAPTFEDANWDYLGTRGGTWPTPVLDDVVARVVKDGMSDRAKLEALYAFVNKEITGDSGSTSNPSATVIEKAGNRSALFEALVRTAGMHYRVGRAMPWNGDSSNLSVATANSAFGAGFLWLEPDGSDPVPFFMGARLAPFGLVPEAYRGSFAFLASEQGGQIIQLGNGGPDVRDTTAFDIHLGESESDVKLSGLITVRNPSGYRGKKQIMDLNEDIRRKIAENQIGSYFAGPTLTNYSMPELEVPGKPLAFRLEGTMSTYLTEQSGRYVAALGLPSVNANSRFVHRSERNFDLVLSPHDDTYDRVVVHLGNRFDLAQMPADHIAVNDIGVYSLTFRRVDDTLVIERFWRFKPARYTPEQYPRFVEWCKSLDDAETVKLEFRKLQ